MKERFLRYENRNISPHIDLRFDPSGLEDEIEREILIGAILDFSEKLIQGYQMRLSELLEKEKAGQKNGSIKNRVLGYIDETNLDAPTIILAETQKADELFASLGFGSENYHWRPGEILMVYKLPKPIDLFWWKEDVVDDANSPKKLGGAEIGNSGIKWGSLYRQMNRFFWQVLEEESENGRLNFSRLNDFSDHKIGKYYYIFNVILK